MNFDYQVVAVIYRTNVQGKKRTVTVSRKCCHGYAPSRAANGHCVKFDLQSVIEVAEKLGAKEFIRSAKNNGLEEKLAENVTLFAPLDEAFTDFAEQMFETVRQEKLSLIEATN